MKQRLTEANDSLEHIRDNVRAAVKKNKATTVNIAKNAGIGIRTLEGFLADRRDMRLSNFLSLSKALGVKPVTLLREK